MFVLRRLPACFALLLLGALSLRLGLAFLLAVPLALALVVVLFIPKPVLQTALGAVLWGGCLAWAGMAWLRVGERMAAGLPWARLVLIFGGVALFTAWAAWLLRTPRPEVRTGDESQP
ncbi:MAG: hypothetical protein LWW79_09810 [Holophagaceae bacterium]|nr:hypothetical protein [Holophagaceae bacterium]